MNWKNIESYRTEDAISFFNYTISMLCDIFIFVILRPIGTSFILMTHFCTTHWIDGPEVEVGRKIRMQLIEMVIHI